MKSLIRTRHLFLFLLLVAVGCNSNSKKSQKSDSENETSLTEKIADNDAGNSFSEGDNHFVFAGINEDLLWNIFLKIPVDSMSEYLFTTIQQRQQARLDSVFNVGFKGENNDNVLVYDETNNDGVRNFMRLACYPTDDGKKLIVIFHYGGGVDIYATVSDQTYEYDIATDDIKAIERPIEPYTADEFFYELIFSSGQLRQIRKAFHEKKPLNYVFINRSGYSMYFAAYDAFEDWDEYEEYGDLISIFYEMRENFVRREWDGKRFVKAESFPPDYLINGKSVGRFKIGEQITLPYKDNNRYTMERSERTEMREGNQEKIIEYTFLEYNDTLLVIKPSYNYETDTYTDKIGEIIICSEKYKTKDKIGVNSAIDDFITMYPNNRFWWTYVSDIYVLDSEDIGDKIQFLLDAEDCIIEPKTDSDMTILKRSNFKKDSQIKKIRVL